MTLTSARRILRLLREFVPYNSIADFGCGSGTWLSVAIDDFGASRALGFEGPWMTQKELDHDKIDFQAHDLEQHIELPQTVDLAISLEVAEHLSERRAPSFVADLCAASPCVLFGAAIPGQGGVGHVNEQWPSYWAELFKERDYQPFDLIRPSIWGESELPYWYRQNVIFYARRDKARELDLHYAPFMLDVIHPRRWEEELEIPIWRRMPQVLKSKLPWEKIIEI
jgi:hypothetical protein